MIKKEEYIRRKLYIVCELCHKKTRIIKAMHRELPEEGTLDEMEDIFEEIYKREV